LALLGLNFFPLTGGGLVKLADLVASGCRYWSSQITQ